MATTPVKVGVISIGEMGLGIAKLLCAHGYSVLTNITGRRCVDDDSSWQDPGHM